MLRASKTRKAILLFIAFSLTVTAASADFVNDGYSTVWQNSEWMDNNDGEPVTNASMVCNDGESFTISSDAFDSSFDSNLITGDFSGVSTDAVKLQISCASSGNSDTDEVLVNELITGEISQHGEGFVGSVLGEDARTEALIVEGIDVDGSEIDEEQLGFGFDDKLSLEENGVDLADSGKIEATLSPKVEEYFTSSRPLEISYGGEVVKKLEVDTKIHPWKVTNVASDLPRQMDFRDIENGEFEYVFDARNDGERNRELLDQNFTLEIRGVGDDAPDVDDNLKEGWLKSEETENHDYRVWLNNVPSGLETGSYRFTIYLKYGDKSSDRYVLDSTRVEKRLGFSGNIRNSKGSGIKTNMVLKNAERTYPLSTEDGVYSTYVVDDIYNSVNMEFYDLGESSPDARFSLQDVNLANLAKETDISRSSESVSFEYWQNPDRDIEAVNPVNMMAVKFAHNIQGSASAQMKFNPANIDPAELQVFECNDWNFLGTECLGEWERVPEEDVSVNYANWEAKIDNLNLHEVSENVGGSEKNILMNAYIVGTSADLVLNNGISITGTDRGRVETGGEVEVSGRIVSENENDVEGAEVDVKFYHGRTEVHSFDTVETDAEGRFSVEGAAPEEPGNYTVKIEANADNYNGLSTEFDDRFETFIAEGIGVDAESPLEVTLGQETSTIVDIENVGQTEMQNIEFSVSGLNSDFYSVSRESFSSIEAGEKVTTEIVFDIPESYGVDDYPQLDIEVSAENAEGEGFTDTDSIQTQLTYASDTQEESSDTSDTSDTEEESSFSTKEVAEMTGEFLESQSSLNIALGLILVFLMALIGAMKKKKDDRDDRRRGDRPKVQRPSLQRQDSTPQQEEDSEDVDSQIDEIAGAFEEEGEKEVEETVEEAEDEESETEVEEEEEDDRAPSSEQEEVDGFVCDVCGERFDSESGRDLHESVMHE